MSVAARSATRWLWRALLDGTEYLRSIFSAELRSRRAIVLSSPPSSWTRIAWMLDPIDHGSASHADPEALHDIARLRGLSLAAAGPDPADFAQAFASWWPSAQEYVTNGMGLPRGVFWDTSTAALRLLSLLRLHERLSSPSLTDRGRILGLPREFLVAHQLPLSMGRASEAPGNHQAVNAAGSASLHFLLHPEAPLPRRRALALAGVFAGQFLADGGHIEHSPHYHLQVMELMDLIGRIDASRGGELQPLLTAALEGARGALRVLIGPDGAPFRFGDIGRSFSGESNRSQAARWLGPEAERFEPGHWMLPQFGIARCDWIARGARCTLAVDFGPVGLADNPGHGHADSMSYLFFVDGEEIVVDPGTYLYSDEPEAMWFKLPEAHSSLRWPGDPLYAIDRYFRWRSAPDAARIHVDRPGEPGGSFTATLRSSSKKRSLVHHRHWLPHRHGLAVHDEIRTDLDTAAVLRIPLHPAAHARFDSSHSASIESRSSRVSVEIAGWNAKLAQVPAWYSSHYGIRSEAIALESEVPGGTSAVGTEFLVD